MRRRKPRLTLGLVGSVFLTLAASDTGWFIYAIRGSNLLAASGAEAIVPRQLPGELPAVRGGGGPADCAGEWRVAGAVTVKPIVRCINEDASCDFGNDDQACIFAAQLCFLNPDNPLYEGKCILPGSLNPSALSLTLRGRQRDETDQSNWETVLRAVAALGGTRTLPNLVRFEPPPMKNTCTEPFGLIVPLKQGGGSLKKGRRRLKTVTSAGKPDIDRLRLVCAPRR